MSVRYDLLVKKYLSPEDSILDLGCGNGIHQQNSKLAKLLELNQVNYLGLDIEKSKLRSIQTDLFDYQPEREHYNVITAFEVFEHIPVTRWKELFLNYYQSLRNNGLFIISVPYKQDRVNHWKRKLSNNKDLFEPFKAHTVFNLSKKDFELFFQALNLEIETTYKVIVSKTLFRDQHGKESTLKATLRYCKRVLFKLLHLDRSNTYLTGFNLFLQKRSLLVITRKRVKCPGCLKNQRSSTKPYLCLKCLVIVLKEKWRIFKKHDFDLELVKE